MKTAAFALVEHRCTLHALFGEQVLAEASSKISIGRFSAMPRPFLRWAGSKQGLLAHIVEHLPANYNRYFEPFLGSGALFFHVKPKRALLSDVSKELVAVWTAVRDQPNELLDYLLPLKPDRDLYYKIRNSRSEDATIRAAEFLYLNKTCWNGLYRVNSRGEFNVPYGAPRSDFIVDEQNLRSCSSLLSSGDITIDRRDFESSIAEASEGDFVYLDPPYVTKHNFNGFRDYNEKLFSWDDQIRLASAARRLVREGVHVVVSNAMHKDVLDLYPEFDHHFIERSSTLSSNKAFRGKVSEVVMVGRI